MRGQNRLETKDYNPSMPSLHHYLSILPDLGARPQLGMRPADFTLDRMEFLMEVLGHPERWYPSLHIAGTNGKGSVAAFCTAALQAQGYRVGRFTSPHLAGALAGISVNNEQVGQDELEKSFQLMLGHLEQRHDWTQFEVVTALALAHFASARVDAAVIEVGLGGRLDATNVISPLVSVITPVDYDHTSILGKMLGEIAREKSGIIKSGVPVVISSQVEEAWTSILEVAKQKGVPVIEVGKDVRFERIGSDLSGQEFWVAPSLTPSWPQAAHSGQAPPLEKGRGPSPRRVRLRIGMLGLHQIENAATAFAALQAASQRGLPVSEAAIERGFAIANWPGRFELVRKDPPVVLDAAHSPAAARALHAALEEYFPGRPIILVIGVSADKDLASIIEPLRTRIVRALATQTSHPRAMPTDELKGNLSRLGFQAEAEPDAGGAIKKALQRVKKGEMVVVCGSVFLVELARSALDTLIAH